MKMTFLGATREVTGSCTYLEAAGKRFIVDYGMEQGKDTFETEPLPIQPVELDFALLTHAHVDHSGMLPLLYKKGFRGGIYATEATANLAKIMLADCAHIQESDAEYKTRKNLRAGRPPVEPIYDSADVAGMLPLLKNCRYNECIEIAPGIRARFIDAGHLLGSSSIELWLTEGNVTKKIVFSGDVGNVKQPLLRDPQLITEADYAVIESTYGTREHELPPDTATELAAILQETFDRDGNVVIPSFAVGRTQEMLYFIRRIKEEGLVHGHDGFPVYVDSPLAIKATRVCIDNAQSCYDEEARALLDKGVNPIGFDGLYTAVTSEESIAINTDETPKVILSASGMCEAGRIRHHLKHNLWRPECTILFVGYQAVGTLGRTIVDGADEIELFGETISVQAQIRVLAGVSGHGDRNQLLRWAGAFSPAPKQMFVNHGDNDSALGFAQLLNEKLGINAMAPASGTEYDLANGCFIRITDPIPVKKHVSAAVAEAIGKFAEKHEDIESAYRKLERALARLTELVANYRNESEQNIASLRNAIYNAADKFSKLQSNGKSAKKAERKSRNARSRAKKKRR